MGSGVVGGLFDTLHTQRSVWSWWASCSSTCFSDTPSSSSSSTSHKSSSFPSPPGPGHPLLWPSTNLQTHHTHPLYLPSFFYLLQPPYFMCSGRKCKISEVGAHTLEYVSLRAQFFHLPNFVQRPRWQTSWCNA